MKYDKKKCPRVTTVISEMMDKSWLWRWKRRIGEQEAAKISRETAGIGTLVHYRVLKKLVKHSLPDPDIEYKKLPGNARDLCEIAELQFDDLTESGTIEIQPGRIDVEQTEIHRKHRYAGTYDLAATMKVNGGDFKWTIADIKTSAQAHDNHFVQLGAYSLLINPPPEQGVIICLCPYEQKNQGLQGKIYVIDKEELEARAIEFLGLLDGYKAKINAKL